MSDKKHSMAQRTTMNVYRQFHGTGNSGGSIFERLVMVEPQERHRGAGGIVLLGELKLEKLIHVFIRHNDFFFFFLKIITEVFAG